MTAKPGWEGRFFDDFTVGDVYRSKVGRTITEADNIQFSLLTANTNPIHIDAHYASKTEFGRPLVNSTMTIAIVTGLAVSDTSLNGFALGWDDITLPHPLFAGDTLYAESEVTAKRESRSRPGWGIVTLKQRGVNQKGDIVLLMTRTFMVPTRAAAPARDVFPTPKER